MVIQSPIICFLMEESGIVHFPPRNTEGLPRHRVQNLVAFRLTSKKDFCDGTPPSQSLPLASHEKDRLHFAPSFERVRAPFQNS